MIGNLIGYELQWTHATLNIHTTENSIAIIIQPLNLTLYINFNENILMHM